MQLNNEERDNEAEVALGMFTSESAKILSLMEMGAEGNGFEEKALALPGFGDLENMILGDAGDRPLRFSDLPTSVV